MSIHARTNTKNIDGSLTYTLVEVGTWVEPAAPTNASAAATDGVTDLGLLLAAWQRQETRLRIIDSVDDGQAGQKPDGVLDPVVTPVAKRVWRWKSHARLTALSGE